MTGVGSLFAISLKPPNGFVGKVDWSRALLLSSVFAFVDLICWSHRPRLCGSAVSGAAAAARRPVAGRSAQGGGEGAAHYRCSSSSSFSSAASSSSRSWAVSLEIAGLTSTVVAYDIHYTVIRNLRCRMLPSVIHNNIYTLHTTEHVSQNKLLIIISSPLLSSALLFSTLLYKTIHY